MAGHLITGASVVVVVLLVLLAVEVLRGSLYIAAANYKEQVV